MSGLRRRAKDIQRRIFLLMNMQKDRTTDRHKAYGTVVNSWLSGARFPRIFRSSIFLVDLKYVCQPFHRWRWWIICKSPLDGWCGKKRKKGCVLIKFEKQFSVHRIKSENECTKSMFGNRRMALCHDNHHCVRSTVARYPLGGTKLYCTCSNGTNLYHGKCVSCR
jgi:hypothetical protein